MTLSVNAATRRTAIFKIMAELGAMQVGTRLRLTELMAGWTRVGLRADDLSTGLNESFADGTLEFAFDAQESAIWLTAAGKAWAEQAQAERDASTGDGANPEQVLQAAQQRGEASGDKPPTYIRDRRKS
jgi:hypothetical protein